MKKLTKGTKTSEVLYLRIENDCIAMVAIVTHIWSGEYGHRNIYVRRGVGAPRNMGIRPWGQWYIA